MSTLPDNEFDLEKLFLPAWAQEASSASKYAKYEGEAEQSDRRGERQGGRPHRPEGRPGGRSLGRRPGGDRRASSAGGPEHARAAQGERQREPYRGPRSDAEGNRRGGRRPEPRPHREPPPPLPEIQTSVVPEEKGVESLARQIKMSGRAYPLFDIAQMILQKPERHGFTFAVKKNAEGQAIQPLFLCALDDTLWLSEDEAVAHVLRKHFSTFYQAERTATEPPKGKYTFVAQCGMSGIVLGPPNHHDYQNQLRKLHSERFSRMPFEVYKSRVKIVRDEEIVKKWVDDQSWKTEYVCLNMPDALRLAGMDAVEKHFRENHKDNIIKPVESHTASGVAVRGFRSPELNRLVRTVWEDQRRFPLQIATVLSQQFAAHGLQFFKVDRTFTHVSVARPHYLDLDLIPVSDGVKRIVEFINSHSKCNRKHLIEALAPSPAPAAVAVGTEGAAPPVTAEASGPTAEQTAVIADLHWLIHQGHVIEFANGILETAKKPLPKPPKPPAKLSSEAVPPPAAADAPAEGATSAPAPTIPTDSVAESAPPENPVSGEQSPPGGEPGASAPVGSADNGLTPTPAGTADVLPPSAPAPTVVPEGHPATQNPVGVERPVVAVGSAS